MPRDLSTSFVLRCGSVPETAIVDSVEERFGVFAAMFRVEQVVASSASESSESSGVGRSDNGRFWSVGRRWAGAGGWATGDGESEGLFSLEAESGSSESYSESESEPCGLERAASGREGVSNAR